MGGDSTPGSRAKAKNWGRKTARQEVVRCMVPADPRQKDASADRIGGRSATTTLVSEGAHVQKNRARGTKRWPNVKILADAPRLRRRLRLRKQRSGIKKKRKGTKTDRLGKHGIYTHLENKRTATLPWLTSTKYSLASDR